MTPEAYLDELLALPAMWRAQVSRDGSWVAWTWYRTGPAADVYAAPTDSSQPPIRLTETADDTLLVSWAPDGRSVIVEQDRDGNERVQLFQIYLAQPGHMIPLTEADPHFFVRGGDLHPNGDILVYGANFDLSTGREIEPTYIFRQDLSSGERRVLARPEKAGYTRPSLSPTGEYVLYSRKDRHPSGRQVWLVDIEGDRDREILNFGPDVKAFASWFPDGRRIVVLAEAGTHRRVGVWQLDSEEVRWVLDDPSRNIEDAYVPYGCDQIVLVEYRNARLQCSLIDPTNGQETSLAAPQGSLQPLAPLGDGTWVGQIYSSRQPDELIRFSAANIDPQHFVSLSRVWERTALSIYDLTQAEEYSWPSVDGLQIHGWLYRAQGEPKGTLVYVHGGPTAHSEDAINSQIQFYARQGFNVLAPNYRGSTGYGLAYQEAIKEEGWGGREQEDIRTGIEAMVEAGLAEPGRVGITGTSYGGYSSWWAITHFPPKVVAAAAPICGMTDLVVDYETTRPDLRPYSEEMLGGTPAEVPERYAQRSPINVIANIRGRLLIVQGAQDPNVTPENVRVVVENLHQAGVPYEILSFEDEGHGISRPANQRTLYLKLATFFERAFEPSV